MSDPEIYLARAVIARDNAPPALAVTEDVLRDALARERREWGQSTIDTRGAVDMALDAIRPFLVAPDRTAEVERLTAERDDLKLWFAECDSIVEGHVKRRAELTAELATVTERLRAVEANQITPEQRAVVETSDAYLAAVRGCTPPGGAFFRWSAAVDAHRAATAPKPRTPGQVAYDALNASLPPGPLQALVWSQLSAAGQAAWEAAALAARNAQ